MKKFLPISSAAIGLTAAIVSAASASAALPVSAFKMPSANNQPAKVNAAVNSSVKCDTIVNEDFSKWTKGSLTEPSTEMVTDEMVPELMSYPGDWTLFQMYEAGGAGFMGFDNVGDHGPGYIKTPGINFLDESGTGIYRFSCRVMNVNSLYTNQSFQAFIMDEANSSIITASTQPMEYGEWSECSWLSSTTSPSVSFMGFGWNGNVLIDRLVVEKLVYPLATPVVKRPSLNEDGTVALSWNKVEGATSYSIEVYTTFGDYSEVPMISTEVGDVAECNIDFSEVTDYSNTFIFCVTAKDGDKISFPGRVSAEIKPEFVGTPVALAATDVTANGFTANWEAAAFASNYLVLPRVKHTAQESELYYILNEDFRNVPEDADDFNAIMIAPIMGYEGMDLYFSRAGWSCDMGVMMQLMPGLPIFALTNQYAMMGLPGQLVSPVTDFSVGGGKVIVSGMALSSVDDVVMECKLVDAFGKTYASEEFEITKDGDMFEVTLEGGKANSRLIMVIKESADEGDMVVFTNIEVAVTLESGESITVPAETVHAEGSARSVVVECDNNEYNDYSYAVMGYVDNTLIGEPSEYVVVDKGTAVKALSGKDAKAFISGGVLNVLNPAGERCEIYTLDGKLVKSSSAKVLSLDVNKGVYIVKVANKSFKIAY